jgi:hypothetical protein
VARGDGRLERLYDEFSRSGVDYLRERTFRVGGGGYVVERTTPYGTTYFYEPGRR